MEDMWALGAGTFDATLSVPEYYSFALEKTVIKRLPAPYSRPSCIEQGSTEALEKNLFIGVYTQKKCERSCDLRGYFKCGAVRHIDWIYVRNKNHWKQFLNDSAIDTEVDSCLDSLLKSYWECAKRCYQPCVEERYR